MFRTVKLQFFGEVTPDQDTAGEQVFNGEEELNSVFDTPSPLLSVGGVSADEGSTETVPENEGTGGGEQGDVTPVAEPVQQQAPAPFKVLKGAGGQDIPFATEADYERAALEGIGVGAIKQRVGAYEPFLSALEN
ncbi:MAG: hypothetical protein RR214_01150, partial [Synergistaceae bacterium]